jgi:hypothetical protein
MLAAKNATSTFPVVFHGSSDLDLKEAASATGVRLEILPHSNVEFGSTHREALPRTAENQRVGNVTARRSTAILLPGTGDRDEALAAVRELSRDATHLRQWREFPRFGDGIVTVRL